MSYVLGLDGGGTKTLITSIDRSGAVIGLTSGESLDPTSSTDWQARLSDQLAEAAAGRGAPSAAVFGLSFHDEIKTFTAQQEEVAARLLPSSRVVVENDVRIAFDGAFASGGGVLLLAGTGSMAWASRNGPDDPHHRIGGWGDAFGDEGSAYWVGRKSLAIASQALDGRRPDDGAFAAGILDGLAIAADSLIDWIYTRGSQRTAIAGVARITASLAASGSPTAKMIVEQACDHLAAHVRAAERQLSGTENERQRWSYAGGVFSNSAVLDGVTRRLGSNPVAPMLPPIGGAALRAARLAGWNADDAFIHRLNISLQQALQHQNSMKGE